jgi:hypothetical protein
MSANVSTSSRGTRWDLFLGARAFRAGFDDVRQGRNFDPKFDERSVDWQWSYECGRLFAASPCSARWKSAATFNRPTATLIAAYQAARRTLDIPPSGSTWS